MLIATACCPLSQQPTQLNARLKMKCTKMRATPVRTIDDCDALRARVQIVEMAQRGKFALFFQLFPVLFLDRIIRRFVTTLHRVKRKQIRGWIHWR